MPKLHPNKIMIVVLIMFLFGLMLIVVNMTNNLRQTKDELTLFFTISFDSCTLTKLEKRKYPGRGDYSVFYTDCKSDHFPILLDKGNNTARYDLFKENIKLIKDSNSVELTLMDDNSVIHKVRIRRPENEDDRTFSTKIISILMGIGIATAILLPNKLFEKMEW